MSTRHALVLTGLATLAACGRGDGSREVAVSNSLSHELEIAPPDTAAAAPSPGKPERESRSGATPAAREPSAARKSAGAETRVAGSRAREAKASSPSVGVPPTDSAAVRDSGRTAADSTPVVAVRADSTRSDSTRFKDSASAQAAGSGAAHPLAPPPPPVTAAPSPTTTAAAHTVPAGTRIRALLQDSITSLRNSEGQTVTAFVSGDLRASDGRTVVPSGSAVRLSITRLRPAPTRSARDGELELRADSITVAGHTYPVSAQVQPVPHELKGRGVTAGEAEKVGAGAAVGAVAGGVITGKTKGAVIGGVVGAAGGAVVAAQTASRDVIVAPNTPLVLILTAPLAGSRGLP